MDDQFDGIEPMVLAGAINIPYTWWAGDTASAFLAALRDEERITGAKCPACGKVYCPPRRSCPACFTERTEALGLSSEGTLLSWTVVRRRLASLPKEAPLLYGLVKLDGADTAMLHFLDEVRPGDLAIGMRVRAVFARERRGSILDISHFKPAARS